MSNVQMYSSYQNPGFGVFVELLFYICEYLTLQLLLLTTSKTKGLLLVQALQYEHEILLFLINLPLPYP